MPKREEARGKRGEERERQIDIELEREREIDR